jgi:hypothetical protein
MLNVRQDRDAASYRSVLQYSKIATGRKCKESLDSYQGRHYVHHVECHDRGREFIASLSSRRANGQYPLWRHRSSVGWAGGTARHARHNHASRHRRLREGKRSRLVDRLPTRSPSRRDRRKRRWAMFSKLIKIDRRHARPVTVAFAASKDNSPRGLLIAAFQPRVGLVCRWHLDPMTGRPVCCWQLEGGEVAPKREPLPDPPMARAVAPMTLCQSGRGAIRTAAA